MAPGTILQESVTLEVCKTAPLDGEERTGALVGAGGQVIKFQMEDHGLVPKEFFAFTRQKYLVEYDKDEVLRKSPVIPD